MRRRSIISRAVYITQQTPTRNISLFNICILKLDIERQTNGSNQLIKNHFSPQFNQGNVILIPLVSDVFGMDDDLSWFVNVLLVSPSATDVVLAKEDGDSFETEVWSGWVGFAAQWVHA